MKNRMKLLKLSSLALLLGVLSGAVQSAFASSSELYIDHKDNIKDIKFLMTGAKTIEENNKFSIEHRNQSEEYRILILRGATGYKNTGVRDFLKKKGYLNEGNSIAMTETTYTTETDEGYLGMYGDLYIESGDNKYLCHDIGFVEDRVSSRTQWALSAKKGIKDADGKLNIPCLLLSNPSADAHLIVKEKSTKTFEIDSIN